MLAQTMINGGAYGRHRILTAESVHQMISNENATFPGNDHGLGFELHQPWYMGRLSSAGTADTGTSLVIDFSSAWFVILLTKPRAPEPRLGQRQPDQGRGGRRAGRLILRATPREGPGPG